MSEIKRFNYVISNYGDKSFTEHPYGNYCNYSDYESERQAHLQTKKELEELRVIANDLQFAYWNKDEDFPHGFETDAIENYRKYLEASRKRNKT